MLQPTDGVRVSVNQQYKFIWVFVNMHSSSRSVWGISAKLKSTVGGMDYQTRANLTNMFNENTPVLQPENLGLYSPIQRTSYRKILWSLETARFIFGPF